MVLSLFFFHHPATTAFYTLSLHDALPIFRPRHRSSRRAAADRAFAVSTAAVRSVDAGGGGRAPDSRDRHAGGGRARGGGGLGREHRTRHRRRRRRRGGSPRRRGAPVARRGGERRSAATPRRRQAVDGRRIGSPRTVAASPRAVVAHQRSRSARRPRRRSHAGQRRSQAAAADAAQVVRRRSCPSRVFSRRSRARRARPQRQPQDRRRLAGAEPLMASPYVSVKFTPAGRTVSFLLPDLKIDGLTPGDQVVVNGAEGPALGTVTRIPPQVGPMRQPDEGSANVVV